jgi:hypothetical protein
MNSYQNVSGLWTPDYHKKAATIQRTNDRTLDEMLHVALENAISCEASGMQERQLYWLRCAMLAQDEMTRGIECR